MAFPWKIREISRNLPGSSGNFCKQQNLREISGNGSGRFQRCVWECYVVFHMFCPQFSGKTIGKISHSPRVDICDIYLPMVNWWMACMHPNNGVHFHFMKILENQGNLREFSRLLREFFKTSKSQGILMEWLWQISDLKLIDVINVSYMFIDHIFTNIACILKIDS